MLHFISWKVYSIVLVVGLVAFYGYVGVKNFRLLRPMWKRVLAAARNDKKPSKKVDDKEVSKVEDGFGPG